MSDDLPPSTYRELIDHTVDMLTIFDESGTIRYESPSVRQALGYDPDELVGESVFEYIHPDDRDEAIEMFAEAVEMDDDSRVAGLEFRFRHRDGSWVWLEARGENVKLDSIDGYVISSRDISDRKEYERQIRQERDRLDQFASIVSHDLRNPLQVAQIQLEFAREECASDHLETATQAVERMDELVEDLRMLARTGSFELETDGVDVREVVPMGWETVDTRAATLQVEVDRTVQADESQFKQLFENLFRNAVEHGGEDVTVTVGPLDEGFYVEDDGRGIPEDARDSLLEYGFTTKADGTGFGLSIVNQIVENHGWSLTVGESDAGGARFEVTGVTDERE